jgi:clan AA aspartic protease
MMTGSVSGRRALIPVTFRLPNHPDVQIEFVLDTGFNGFLTLPPRAVATLQLPFRYRIPIHLADGSSAAAAIHSATILWHGSTRSVEVIATGRQPLLGTSLLHGSDLTIHFDDGGAVSVTPF